MGCCRYSLRRPAWYGACDTQTSSVSESLAGDLSVLILSNDFLKTSRRARITLFRRFIRSISYFRQQSQISFNSRKFKPPRITEHLWSASRSHLLHLGHPAMICVKSLREIDLCFRIPS